MQLLSCNAVWLLLGTDVSEERMASVIKVKSISELGTALQELATEARCEEILTAGY
jgi:hypothetical protein